MMKEKITVALAAGLQGLTAGKLVQITEQYTAEVYIEKGYKKIDAKSILGVISLGVEYEEEITLVVEGVDQEDLFQEVHEFLTGKSVQFL